MKKRLVLGAFVGIACLVATSPVGAQYQSPQAGTVDKATNVLNEFMTMPNQGIPRSMIQKAQGIVIVPGMIKLGFVVGGRRGKGIVVVRDENGAWRAPSFVTMTGGSVGFQAGVQSTDVVLVFNTRNSVNNLMSGKFTIGVDAAAAAGPVGRQAAAATDGRLQSEIYSYSRSRGLFAGASVDGSVIQMDVAETQNYYRAAGMSADGRPVAPNAQLPLSASQFLAALGTYSGSAVAAPAASPPGTLPTIPGTAMGATAAQTNSTATLVPGGTSSPTTGATGSVLPPGSTGTPAATGVFPPGSTTVTGTPANPPAPNARTLEVTRQELAKSAQGLGALLDDSWRKYLSLPQVVFTQGQDVPTSESLQQSMQRFDAVARDSKYTKLLQRREFQQTYALLRTYIEQVNAVTAATASPSASAPPTGGARGSIR